LYYSNIFASNYFVSADATGAGNGSISNPWKLQQALNSPLSITNPVDTVWVWLKGGTYTDTLDAQNSFTCLTNGKVNAPIIFRNLNNERVTIDGQLSYTMSFVLGNCSYTWIWGLEFTNSSTADRDHPTIDRLGNVYCTAENIKFINLIVHDMGSGLDLWKTSKNSESYGNIIYNIGNNLANGVNWEGHGHGMYLQNDTMGTKYIHNNIVFNTFGYGIKVWQTTTTAAIGNFDIQKNIVFNGGTTSENMGGVGNNYRTHNFFVVANGANNPIINTVIKNNYTYSGNNSPRPPVNAFGLNFGVKNFVLDSNYFTCQTRLGYNNTSLFDASVKGNNFIAGILPSYGYYLWGFAETDYPQNKFLSTQPSIGLEYFILPNKYDLKRSHLVIYNWESANIVQINIKNSGLKAGDKYELINTMDYFNDVISGIVPNDGIINVPMTGHTFSAVIGSKKPSTSQFPIFGAFVIRKTQVASTINENENETKNEIIISPNPSYNIFNLKFLLKNSCNYDMIITDMNGKETTFLKDKYLSKGNNEVQISMKDYQDGVYFINICGKFNSIKSKLIFKK
jgi:hypothetical protein